MQEKQKVTTKITLYVPEDLHHQLKISSAINKESMSDIAQKALSFYLSHQELVERAGVGHIHQVYNCPECTQSIVFRDGELLAIGGGHRSSTSSTSQVNSQDEELVPC